MATMSPEIEQSVQAYLRRLEVIDGSFHFEKILEEYKAKAEKDDIAMWFVFKNIINDLIKDSTPWTEKPNLVFGLFYILIDLDNEKAYALMKWYLQQFREDVPHGGIELLSTLIPAFSLVNPADFFMYVKSKNEALSAIGFLTLFNLLMEGRLKEKEEKMFLEIAKKYENGYFYMGNIIEMIETDYKLQKESKDKIDLNLA